MSLPWRGLAGVGGNRRSRAVRVGAGWPSRYGPALLAGGGLALARSGLVLARGCRCRGEGRVVLVGGDGLARSGLVPGGEQVTARIAGAGLAGWLSPALRGLTHVGGLSSWRCLAALAGRVRRRGCASD